MAKEKRCFVIAPIGEDKSEERKRSDQVFESIILPAMKDLGYNPVRADMESIPGKITDDVIRKIREDPLVIADMTGQNANVIYEIALRHATQKPIVHIMNEGEEPPFDLHNIRIIYFNHKDKSSRERAIESIIKQVKIFEKKGKKSSTSISVVTNEIMPNGNQKQPLIPDFSASIFEIRTMQQNQLDKLETIVKNQQNQFDKLETIGYQMKDQAEKFRRTSIQETVNKFFIIPNIEKNRSQKYKCFVPVHYRSQPLPVISQGDYYAIHVLGTLLGDNKLELKGISSEDVINEEFLKDNAIFVCAPKSNQVLKTVFDHEKIKNEKDMERLEKWPLEGLGLPCWFIEDFRDNNNTYPITKIKIFDESSNYLLESPAQIVYNAASNSKPGQKFIFKGPYMNLQRDYGIFARLKRDGNQYIIIAGLHQYGTWIIASFLSNLLSDYDVPYKSKFLGKEDFIAVITGEFNNDKLTVQSGSINVLHNYIWIKDEETETWIRTFEEGVPSPSF